MLPYAYNLLYNDFFVSAKKCIAVPSLPNASFLISDISVYLILL